MPPFCGVETRFEWSSEPHRYTALPPPATSGANPITQAAVASPVGAGAFAGSGLVALYAIGCLLACAIIAISGVVAAWLAALIVGAALLAVSGIAALIGKSRLTKATPPVPKEAIGSVQADVQEVKEKAHR